MKTAKHISSEGEKSRDRIVIIVLPFGIKNILLAHLSFERNISESNKE